MANPISALVVDDSSTWRDELRGLLENKGFEVVAASDRRTALAALGNQSFDVAIIDVNLADAEHNVDGLLINRYIQDQAIETRVILISARSLSTQELADACPATFIDKSNLWRELNALLDQIERGQTD